jgi:hypothetical protein
MPVLIAPTDKFSDVWDIGPKPLMHFFFWRHVLFLLSQGPLFLLLVFFCMCFNVRGKWTVVGMKFVFVWFGHGPARIRYDIIPFCG